MPKAAAKAKAWLRLCATRRIRNIVINLISACNARQAHTVRVCVCVSVCAWVCLSDKSRQRRQKQLQLKPTFARILADFVQSAELALKLWQRAVKAPVAVGGVARSEMSRGNIFAKQVAINLIYMYVNRRRWHPQTTPRTHTHKHTHKYTHARLVQGLEPVRTLYANIAL